MVASAEQMTDTDFRDPATRDLRLRLERLSRFMDSAVRLPGTDFRFGADAVMSILPGVGSLAAAAVSVYLVFEAGRFGLPRRDILRMAGNVAADALVGAVPVVGFIFDAAFRANDRNMKILREHLDRTDRVLDLAPAAGGGWR